MKIDLSAFCPAALFLALSMGSVFSQDLEIGLWDGEFSSKFDDSIVQSWRADTGVAITIDTNADATAKIRAASAGGGKVWDVVSLSGAQERRLCEAGSIEKLASQLSGSLGHLSKQADCGVPYLSFGQTITFAGNVDDGPSRVSDFFDEGAFPGRRGLSASPKGTLELALLADGVSPDNIYDILSSEEGIRRAFAKLDTIKPSIVWWTNSSDAIQMLNDGELAVSTAWSSSVNAAINKGAQLAATSQFMMVQYDYLAIPKTGKNVDQAKAFVTYATNGDGLQTIYEGYAGKYSVPWDGVSPIEDPIYVQACARESCPCARGGCSKDCCEDTDGLGGHFEIDELFWNQNFSEISKMFELWRQTQ